MNVLQLDSTVNVRHQHYPPRSKMTQNVFVLLFLTLVTLLLGISTHSVTSTELPLRHLMAHSRSQICVAQVTNISSHLKHIPKFFPSLLPRVFP